VPALLQLYEVYLVYSCSQLTGNQVTSFHIPTEDGESIHAWHVLPLPAYRQHQEALERQPTGHCGDVTTSESLRILKNDPSAKLIVYRMSPALCLNPVTICYSVC
jgi:hypothetical protein